MSLYNFISTYNLNIILHINTSIFRHIITAKNVFLLFQNIQPRMKSHILFICTEVIFSGVSHPHTNVTHHWPIYFGSDMFPSLLYSLALNSFVLFRQCLNLGKKMFHSMRCISKWSSRNRLHKQITCMDWLNWGNTVRLQHACLDLVPISEDVKLNPMLLKDFSKKSFASINTAFP